MQMTTESEMEMLDIQYIQQLFSIRLDKKNHSILCPDDTNSNLTGIDAEVITHCNYSIVFLNLF